MRKAYLGPDTYELRDRDLFFGRNAEGRIVAGMAASEPISILTGASGTGKSSLLRAQVIPTLISRGWCAVYAHPQGEPIRSLKTQLLQQTLPDMDRESGMVERLILQSQGALQENTRLTEILGWFNALEISDRRRSDLLQVSGGGKIPHYPVLAQLLASLLSPAQSRDRLSMLAEFGGGNALSDDPPIGELLEAGPAISMGRERLERLLLLNGDSLADLTESIWNGWASPLGLHGIVFVLDQAEELYTSFGALSSGSHVAHDWRLREQLFESMREMSGRGEAQPFRICFSLRPEWYAQLRVSLGHIAPMESRGVYFLNRFTRDKAREAIAEPAAALGGSVDSGAIDAALDQLSAESDGDEIDPFLLAVCFQFAWEEAKANNRTQIELADLERVAKGPRNDNNAPRLVAGALQWLMDSGLGSLDPARRYDGLEMLQSLFNQDGTRRTVTEFDLVTKPLRDSAPLQLVLDSLDAAGLVRRYLHGTQSLAEVRHERIWSAVSDEVNAIERNQRAAAELRSDALRSFFNKALGLLARFEGAHLEAYVQGGLEEDPLPAWASASIRESFGDVQWDEPAARVFLASLLHAGPFPSRIDTSGEVNMLRPETRRWRAMVAQLLQIASKRVSDISSGGEQWPDNAARQLDLLHRGVRLAPTASTQVLVDPANALTQDARLALVRSLLSAQESEDGSVIEGIRRWIHNPLRLKA